MEYYNKKKGKTDTHYNMDNLENITVSEKGQSDTQKILHDSSYIKCLE